MDVRVVVCYVKLHGADIVLYNEGITSILMQQQLIAS